MPPPSTVLCEICHQKFSTRSLAIHQKSCVKKREEGTCFCPVCDQLVSNDEYQRHYSECKDVNAHLLKKKKDAAAAAAAAKKQAGKAGGASAGAAAAPPPGPRSKIPEAVLRRLEAHAAGAVADTPEQALLKRLGGPCHACGVAKAIAACVGCHTVYCKPCCAMIHEVNAALADHSPMLKEVRGRVGRVGCAKRTGTPTHPRRS